MNEQIQKPDEATGTKYAPMLPAALRARANGQLDGQTVFTHGVELGVARAASRDLVESTDALLNALAQGNPNLRQVEQPRQTRLSQRTAKSP